MAFSLFRKKELPAQAPSEERAQTEFHSDGKGAELLSAMLSENDVTADTVMQIPSAARCINMIAGAAAMLPVKMYRRTDSGVEEITDDPRLEILNGTTGDTVSADSMRIAWVRDFLLGGSAYAYIERKFGIPCKLFYVSERDVSVIKNNEDPIHKHFTYSVRGKTYYPYEMLKILRNTDGFGAGRGIADENPLIISTALNLIKFQRNQTRKGGGKKGYFKSESKVTSDVITEVKRKFRSLYSNEDTENVMFLNQGIDFKEMSSSSAEMQINQNIRTVNDEIMKLFGTSDGILSEATVKNAVMPVLDVMEAAFDSDLLLEEERGKVYFAFDTRELTRGDIQQRYSAYSAALRDNFLQLDEVRAMEDLPPLGFNMIKLGLNDVLLDPRSGKIYTPNTNAMVDLGTGAGAVVPEGNDVGDLEKRGADFESQHPRDKDGKFRVKDLTHEELRDKLNMKIENGEISTRLDKKKQGCHIIGNPSFEKRIENGEFPSYISVSKMEIQNIINSKMFTGQIRETPDGQFREMIVADDYFGVACSLRTGEKVKTKRGVIHYSKSGTHLVPTWTEDSDD